MVQIKTIPDSRSGLLLCGFVLGLIAQTLMIDNYKSDCEKDLPRTQECTLQWVKPEVSK